MKTNAPLQRKAAPAPAAPALAKARDFGTGPSMSHTGASHDFGALRTGAAPAQLECPACAAAKRSPDGSTRGRLHTRRNAAALPDALQAALKRLSGRDLSGVRVHYNSPKPAQLNAYAYAQGPEIHLGPGQEHRLPHEAWHAVQQMQRRVRATMHLGGTPVNDDALLEREADVMGARALAASNAGSDRPRPRSTGAVQLCAGCRRTCGREGKGHAPNAPVQRAQCGNDPYEWYLGTRADVAQKLIGTSGMQITDDLAHILCCAFCKAHIHTWVYGGLDWGGRMLRYTPGFERLVHHFNGPAQTPTAGGARNVFTEEAYWLPESPASFSAATNLAQADAYRVDQNFWTAVFAVLNPVFTAGAAYPTGLPIAKWQKFDALRNKVADMNAVPNHPWRRSYATEQIRRSGLYRALKLVSKTDPTNQGTEWADLYRLKGTLRVLDFAGDETAAGGAQHHTVVDAKFAYPNGQFDNWAPGQAGNQLSIYREISGNGPAGFIPLVTFDSCCCNKGLYEKLLQEKQEIDLYLTKGKRSQKALEEFVNRNFEDKQAAMEEIQTATSHGKLKNVSRQRDELLVAFQTEKRGERLKKRRQHLLDPDQGGSNSITVEA